MKALILAAGFGTRLKPYTGFTPKPLFKINGQPLIDIAIRQLLNAGCTDIIINTHHLHDQIEAFISAQKYPVPVLTRYEAKILDTGGAIKNVADFWDHSPFFVVNSDILSDIDYKKVYQFHNSHKHPATLVLHDTPEFNRVSVDSDNFIKGFHLTRCPFSKLAFTGIQVLSPEVLAFIPANKFTSSIELYKKLIQNGSGVKAFITKNSRWIDIGTPEKYRSACIDAAAPLAFKTKTRLRPVITKLKGDGSDREWYRLSANGRSIILGDHGIGKEAGDKKEINAFLKIGRHLFNQGIPVPEIYHADLFPGHVYMEDLGDTDLEQTIKRGKNNDRIFFHYRKILKLLVQLSIKGGKDFDLSWPCQTSHYDKNLIIQNECNYFINAFVNPFTGNRIKTDDLLEEFALLADKALEYPVQGFMHRDFQSKNIMLKDGKYYFIDFQGGRSGPVQYDLASLLIDPYVNLDERIQKKLVDYFMAELSKKTAFKPENFLESYHYLSLTRNLQMLGAFGFLSRVKKKSSFENYIPTALKGLKTRIKKSEAGQFTKLKKLIEKI